MNRSKKIIIAVIAILALIVLPAINSYNSMIKLEQAVNKAESDIDTQLQRRSDLIPNLVATVKGYAAQEVTIYTEIANARAKLAGAQTISEKAEADAELSNALSRLLAIVENYPELKSDQNFRDLSVALEGTENRIAIARKDYNDAVNAYNSKIKTFPNVIFANIFGFSEKPYYKASAGAQEVPKVDFTPGE